jgi:hypothetical protein
MYRLPLMARRQRLALLGAATLAAAVACAIGIGHVEGITTGLLYLAPALLLLWPLLRGRYVGEAAVCRLASARTASRRPAGAAVPVAARRPAVLLARGGRLLASAIATRPPPLGA